MAPIDCELLRDGWPAQPVNTYSALAFVAVGLWLWHRGKRLPALFSAAVGIGSMWFHGAPGDTASWAHDITLYALVAVAAVETWRRIAARRPPFAATGFLLVGLVIWFYSRTGGAWCDPDGLVQGHAIWHALAALAAAALFGRGD